MADAVSLQDLCVRALDGAAGSIQRVWLGRHCATLIIQKVYRKYRASVLYKQRRNVRILTVCAFAFVPYSAMSSARGVVDSISCDDDTHYWECDRASARL